MRQITKIIVHCSATKNSQGAGVDYIRALHTKINGWSDIGYHFIIEQDGTAKPGRPLNIQGAHCKGHNSDSIGICLIGGLDEKGKPAFTFSENQMKSLTLLIESMQIQFPIASILGHRDYSPDKNKDGKITKNEWLKVCPCFDVTKFINGEEGYADKPLRRKTKTESGKSEVEKPAANGVGVVSDSDDNNGGGIIKNIVSKAKRGKRGKRSS